MEWESKVNQTVKLYYHKWTPQKYQPSIEGYYPKGTFNCPISELIQFIIKRTQCVFNTWYITAVVKPHTLICFLLFNFKMSTKKAESKKRQQIFVFGFFHKFIIVLFIYFFFRDQCRHLFNQKYLTELMVQL